MLKAKLFSDHSNFEPYPTDCGVYQSQRGIVGTWSVSVSEGDNRYSGPYFVQCTSLRGG